MKLFIKPAAFLFIIASSYMAKAQESKSYTVKNFNSIGISSGIDLYLTQGGSEAVTIKSDEKTLEDIVVEQKGNSINIKFKDGISWSGMLKNRTIKAYVNYKTLTALAASGGSDVFTQNQLKTDKLAISSSGGSDLKLTVVCNDITIQSSGGSDIDAYEFVTDYAKGQASGGSDVSIYVNKGLEASASGGGDVSYKGNASLKKTSSSKSGDVHHVN